jgi:hypothetical protein
MTTLAQSSIWFSIVKAKRDQTLYSHNYVFVATQGPFVLLLPTKIAALQNFKVAFIGAYSSTEFLTTIKKYYVQNAILKAILDFYKSNNPCYKQFEITTHTYAQKDSIID